MKQSMIKLVESFFRFCLNHSITVLPQLSASNNEDLQYGVAPTFAVHLTIRQVSLREDQRGGRGWMSELPLSVLRSSREGHRLSHTQAERAIVVAVLFTVQPEEPVVVAVRFTVHSKSRRHSPTSSLSLLLSVLQSNTTFWL